MLTNPSKSNDCIMYSRVLHSEIIHRSHAMMCMFCMDIRINIDYLPIRHKLTGSHISDGVCLLRGTDWVFK